MINDIFTGITAALRAEYLSTKVYIDEIEQGSKEPCFLIVNITSSQEQKLNNRYWREYNFDIHYFPSNEQGPVKENRTVADNLLMALEYITVNDALVRGTGMRYDETQGVLHFFTNYNVFVKKVTQPLPYMETLTQEDELKAGGDE